MPRGFFYLRDFITGIYLNINMTNMLVLSAAQWGQTWPYGNGNYVGEHDSINTYFQEQKFHENT
jgi:hypothetical protein